MDQHQDLKVALPPYDVNSQQQRPERYSQDNGQQSPQAYHQGYNQPPGYQSVPQNYGQHLQPTVANQAADVGDLTYAKQQNKIARTLLIVTIILGIVCIAVSVVLRMGA